MYYFSATYFLSIGAAGFILLASRQYSRKLQALSKEQWKPIIIGTSFCLVLGGLLCICQMIINSR